MRHSGTRRLALPSVIKDWSLRSLQLKLIKVGARMVRHARRIIFQMVQVAIPRELSAAMLERVDRLRCGTVDAGAVPRRNQMRYPCVCLPGRTRA